MTPCPSSDGISHIDLTVTDRDRSERFYTEVWVSSSWNRVDEPE